MPTVFPDTPASLVGTAGTNFDDFANPTGTTLMNSASVPHADQHANLNDAIERLERLGLLLQGKTVAIANTTVNGSVLGDQPLVTYTVPANAAKIAQTWEIFASGSTDNIVSAGTFTWKMKWGGVIASAPASTSTATTANDWAVHGWLTVSTINSATGQVRGGLTGACSIGGTVVPLVGSGVSALQNTVGPTTIGLYVDIPNNVGNVVRAQAGFLGCRHLGT